MAAEQKASQIVAEARLGEGLRGLVGTIEWGSEVPGWVWGREGRWSRW